ncbi:MAG: hypothetical protein ABI171_16790 [Collimonas sp.]|uniref:hypothetical protein n=1 Tax=Collimonas sp. TaxID=1963772 RepID=UPI003267F7E1
MKIEKSKVVTGVMAMLSASLIAGCASNVTMDAPSTSSYECRPKPVDGLPSTGNGAYGCHFQLHDTVTKGILANTPYWLDVYAPSKPGSPKGEPVATLNGVTDSQGRSGFVRAPFPITPEMVRFIKVIGTGPYGRSPRLLSPINGLGVPGALYQIKYCGGELSGTADEQGYAPMFNSESSCKIEARFYQKR